MSANIERLLQNYPDREFIRPTTKSAIVQLLESLKARVEDLPDFSEFPEGSPGVVVHMLLDKESDSCPDASDFSYFHQGLHAVLQASFEEISRETRWFGEAAHRKVDAPVRD